MVANSEQLEMEMERLARAKSVVVHRSPLLGLFQNRIGYFVCDYNNMVLFPPSAAGRSGGASAEEANRWLLTRSATGAS